MNEDVGDDDEDDVDDDEDRERDEGQKRPCCGCWCRGCLVGFLDRWMGGFSARVGLGRK